MDTEAMSKGDSWRQPIRISLDDKPKRIRPPRGTVWQLSSDFDQIVLKARCSFSLSQFIVTTATCSFFIAVCVFGILGFCGISPDFIKRPEVEPQLWQVILICGLLGFFLLLMSYGLFMTILDAARSEIWVFSKGIIHYGSRFFGVGHLKTKSIANLAAMEIRLEDSELDDEDFESLRKDGMLSELGWELAFLDENGHDILRMPGLDKEEGRWVMDVILREQRTLQHDGG